MANNRISSKGECLKRLQSFQHACNGIGSALATERNLQIHLLASVLVSIAAFVLRLGVAEWRWLLLAMVLVWSAELLNTAIERVCDVLSPAFHPTIKAAKDIAAGAVLVCACGAAGIGLSLFVPALAMR